MAEYNGKQGRWVTVEGRHLFIEDGKDLKDAIKSAEDKKSDNKHANAPKVKRDIGNRLAKNYDACKDELREMFDYIKGDPDRQAEFLKTLEKLPYSNRETVLDAQAALRKNDPEKVYHGAYTSMPQFIKAYAKMTEPGISDEELKDLTVSDLTKKHLSGNEDPVSKQEKDIAKREEQTKALNDEKKANDFEDRKKELVDKYRKEFKDYLKKSNGKLPRQISMGTNTVDKDAILSALNAEYELSPAEDKIWNKIQFQNRGGVPYIWLPGKSPISILGLSNNGISGLRKWLCVWGAKNGTLD